MLDDQVFRLNVSVDNILQMEILQPRNETGHPEACIQIRTESILAWERRKSVLLVSEILTSSLLVKAPVSADVVSEVAA